MPRACPVCKKPENKAYQPFCSKRCADVDLGKWLAESYTVPVEEYDDGDLPDEDAG